MTWYQAIILFAAAILGGMLNSVAGGGTFITLPALIFTGVLPINANATSTIALWPGSLATIGGYRGTPYVERRMVFLLGWVSILGGILGANVLLHTKQMLFLHLVPYLLLFATLLFAFGGTITARLRQRKADADVGTQPFRLSLIWTVILQFGIALYGGFFGGGIGILMLATLSLMGIEDIHSANALKAILAACINGVAIIAFIFVGAVFWGQAIVMILGAIAGGYGGAIIARRLDPKMVRCFVIFVGIVMSLYFFVRR
jgi:uncharacterized protein